MVRSPKGPSNSIVLGGSRVVLSGAIRPLRWVISIVTLLRTPFITNHEARQV